LTEDKSLSGQRLTSAVGNLLPGPQPGSSPAAGALLIELAGPGRACWTSGGRCEQRLGGEQQQAEAQVDAR
jgi:hypothetical protein